MKRKFFMACVAMAMTVTAKAQTEIMVVEQADGTATEYKVSGISKVYFTEAEEPAQPKFIEISEDRTVATINLEYAPDDYNHMCDSIQSVSNVDTAKVIGEFSKMQMKYESRYSKQNPFFWSCFKTLDFSGVTGWTEVPQEVFAYRNVNANRIILPESVTTVGKSAFQIDSNLYYLKGDGVTEIGDYAFYQCTMWGYNHLPTEDFISMPNIERIGKKAFYNCEQMTELSLPKAAKIGANAFENCTALTTLSLPAADSLGADVFAGCKKLTELILTTENDIEVSSFGTDISNQIDLTLNINKKSEVDSLVIWRGMTFASINFEGEDTQTLLAMDGTAATVNLDIAQDENEVQAAISEADSLGVKSYTLKGDFSKLGIWFDGSNVGNPFQGSSVEEIDMSGVTNFTELPGYAFYTVNTLKKITLPETVTTMGKYAFYECTGLEEIVADGATTLEKGTLKGCTALKQIVFPKVTSIQSTTFADCSSVTFIEMDELETMPFCPFSGCNPTEVVFPKLKTLPQNAFISNSNLSKVSLPVCETVSGSAFSKCTALTTLSLPSVVSADASAFANCTSLTTVDLPKLTTAGKYPFNGCTALTSLSLPALTATSEYMFENCTALTTVDLPAVTEIAKYTFYSCSSLTSIDLPKVATIGMGAFIDTSLATLKLTVEGDITLGSSAISNARAIDLTLNADKKDAVEAIDEDITSSSDAQTYHVTASWKGYKFKSITFEE